MSSITVFTKNDFFSYIKVVTKDSSNAAVEMVYRNREQIWNHDGIAIKVQGTDWKGGHNTFGKKHLVTTVGGKHATEADGFQTKAQNILNKRKYDPGNPSDALLGNNQRLAKSITMKGNLQAEKRKDLLKDTTVARNQIGNEVQTFTKQFTDTYAAAVYDPKTNAVTVVNLDGLSKDEAAKAFTDPIKASNLVNAWNDNEERMIVASFPGRVYVLEVGKTEVVKDEIKVKVMKHSSIYHVYHLEP